MDRNDFSEEEAMARIDSQLPLEEKKLKADHVIDNTGLFSDTGEMLSAADFHVMWWIVVMKSFIVSFASSLKSC